MNRFDRLTAILIQLQSKRTIKAQEVADRFEISLRTVYRDIKSLEEAGVPVIGELGVGYSLVEGYKLPPVMFTREEAIAFQFAEKIVENYADTANSERFKSGMYKIKAVLKYAEKDAVEDMAQRIKVTEKRSAKNSATSQIVSSILSSITEKRIIHINYAVWDEQKSDQIINRKIEPIGIFFEEGQWSVIAYCYHIDDYRHFRTERIHSITHTDERFHKKHITLNSFFEKMAQDKDLIKIVIQVDADFAHYIQDQKLNYGFVSEELQPHKVQWTFLANCTEAFTRWFVTYADRGKIIEPEILRVSVKDYITEISKNI